METLHVVVFIRHTYKLWLHVIMYLSRELLGLTTPAVWMTDDGAKPYQSRNARDMHPVESYSNECLDATEGAGSLSALWSTGVH